MTIKEYHVTSRDRLVSVWIVLYGAIDRVILALLHSDRTPYGTRADIKGNGAFAGLDFAAAGATVSTAT